MTADTPLLKVDEAARRLNLSTAKTRRMIRAGELAAVTFGRAVRVPAAAIDQRIAAAMQDAANGQTR